MTDMKEAKAQLKAAKKARPFYKKKRVWAVGAIGLLVIGAAAAPKEEKAKTVVVAAGTADPTTDPTTASAGEAPASAVTTAAAGPTIEGDAGEADDVTPATCEVSSFGTVSMKLTIKNDSSKRSNYIISGVAERDGVKLADMTAFSSNVEAGQTAIEDMSGFLPSGEKGNGVTCRLVEVDRTAA